MLSINDVPSLLEINGGNLRNTKRIESETRQVLLHCGQGTNGRSDGRDNVQILGRAGRVSKEQMATLAENGMGELQQGVDEAETDSRGKWRVFVDNT